MGPIFVITIHSNTAYLTSKLPEDDGLAGGAEGEGVEPGEEGGSGDMEEREVRGEAGPETASNSLDMREKGVGMTTCTYIHVHVHTHVHTCTECTCTCTYTYMYMYMYMYIIIYMYIT